MEWYATREEQKKTDEPDFLTHYGILGMKWGVRRYQNYDGTLTAEGRKRLGRGEKNSNTKEASSLSDSAKSTLKKYGNTMLDRYDNLTSNKRATEAAKLGIKALIKMGPSDLGTSDINDKNSQWWFLNEDQTIGLPVCADLINQGYSAKEAKQIVSDCIKAYEEAVNAGESSDYAYPAIEDLYEGDHDGGTTYRLFINACSEIKEMEKKK